MQVIVSFVGHQEFRNVGCAENDGSRFLQPFNQCGITVSNFTFAELCTALKQVPFNSYGAF